MGKPARRCRPQPRGGRSVPRRGSGSGSERCRPAAAGAEARPRSQRRCKRAPSFHKAQIIGAEPSGSGKPPLPAAPPPSRHRHTRDALRRCLAAQPRARPARPQRRGSRSRPEPLPRAATKRRENPSGAPGLLFVAAAEGGGSPSASRPAAGAGRTWLLLSAGRFLSRILRRLLSSRRVTASRLATSSGPSGGGRTPRGGGGGGSAGSPAPRSAAAAILQSRPAERGERGGGRRGNGGPRRAAGPRPAALGLPPAGGGKKPSRPPSPAAAPLQKWRGCGAEPRGPPAQQPACADGRQNVCVPLVRNAPNKRQSIPRRKAAAASCPRA